MKIKVYLNGSFYFLKLALLAISLSGLVYANTLIIKPSEILDFEKMSIDNSLSEIMDYSMMCSERKLIENKSSNLENMCTDKTWWRTLLSDDDYKLMVDGGHI